MTPFCETNADPSKAAYNASLCKTRVLIEQAFGRLKRRWGILHQEIRMDTRKVPKLVVACLILHNIAIDMNMPDIDFVDDIGFDIEDDVYNQYNGRNDYCNYIVEKFLIVINVFLCLKTVGLRGT